MRTNRIIIITFSAVLALSACQKRVPIVSRPPAPPPNSATIAFDEAQRAFDAGSYDEACRAFENYLRLNPAGSQRDQALFRLGLAYALRTAADWQRASGAFRQIVEGFPASPFKAPANLILTLHYELDQLNASAQQRDQRIKQLTTELDRLKRIDADRRKRP
jgi:outer membrane protein assembly factor BamD (BamD/ComL family)